MKMKFSIDIDVPAEKSWHKLCDGFGNTGEWTSLLDSSAMIGDVEPGSHRECHIGKKVLTENITHVDNLAMRIDYDLIKGRPAIVNAARNSWRVTSLGPNRSRVTMSPNMVMKWWAKPMGPLLVLGLNQTMPKVLEEFKFWAETGRVHPRKAKRNKDGKARQMAVTT
ncbi:SRPBCC family protein [Maritalea porphyrae]|uniref:SRPBCC family protein n=1 Tax=Maritalea porphyrae TaxID=880732 RepID=A0ABQ5USK6_9HYPH|nr:SRPBCC family protein [Maritalea porphyrae]GLQ17361.1 hypothetical protein GCM10007879_16100 [Maritalea porphyrae]